MNRKTTQSQRPEARYDFTDLLNEILGTDSSKKLFEDLATVFLMDPAKHATAAKNAEKAREYGACDTVIPASDTIVESEDGQFISRIPDRRLMYQGQTPQSFHALKLKNLYESLSEEEKAILTDACKIYVIKGEPVHLVDGDVSNIKITYPADIRIAESLIGGK